MPGEITFPILKSVLAGASAVALHDAMLAAGWLAPAGDRYELTAPGLDGLRAWGVEATALKPGRRGLAFACLDWSERRPHLGGPLARAILDAALAKRWVRAAGPGRALTITAAGERGFGELSAESMAA